MSARKNVSASVVRAWARENIALIPAEGHACLGATARGRLHPAVKAAFAKHNKGKGYAETVAEAPVYTVPVETLDKNGRKTTVKRTFTNIEARTLLGQVSTKGDKTIMQRGRMSHGLLSLAASAQEAASLDFSKFQ